MSNDRSEKNIRLLFAHQASNPLPSLSATLSAVGGFAMEELSAPLEDIWRQAIARSPDVTLLYLPDIGQEQERCIRLILRGSLAQVLLLTNSVVSADLKQSNPRLEVYLMPKSKQNFDDIVSHIRKYGPVKSRGGPPRPAYAQNDDSSRAAGEQRGASVMVDAALASKIIAVGASTGGTDALATFLHGLRPNIPGMVIVQHMPPTFTAMFADRLNRELPFEIAEAEDNVQIRPNCIFIAPGDRHLRIRKKGSLFYTVVSGTNKVNGHCPSVDVLFDSVAEVAGHNASGVILTGMGGDGAVGMLKMRQSGAFNIGQDEASSVVYGMPRKAYELGAVSKQASLTDIAGILTKHLGL